MVRKVPYIAIIVFAIALQILFFGKSSYVSIGLLWAGCFMFSMFLAFKFDLIKMDDCYERGTSKEELRDYLYAIQIFNFTNWMIILILFASAVIVRGNTL